MKPDDPSPELPAAFARHAREVSILSGPDVSRALTEGRFKVTVASAMALAEHVLKIYDRRAKHLAAYKSAHAQRLAGEVSALCARLAEPGPAFLVAISEIELEGGRLVSLVERANNHALLGCITSVDRRQVSEQEWASLWRDLNGTLPER